MQFVLKPTNMTDRTIYYLDVNYAKNPILDQFDGFDGTRLFFHEQADGYYIYYTFWSESGTNDAQCIFGIQHDEVEQQLAGFRSFTLLLCNKTYPFRSNQLDFHNGSSNSISSAHTNLTFSGLSSTSKTQHFAVYDLNPSLDLWTQLHEINPLIPGGWMMLVPTHNGRVWGSWITESTNPISLSLALCGYCYDDPKKTTLIDADIGTASNSTTQQVMDISNLAKSYLDNRFNHDDFGVLPYSKELTPLWEFPTEAQEMSEYLKSVLKSTLKTSFSPDWQQCDISFGAAQYYVRDGVAYWALDNTPLPYYPVGTVDYITLTYDQLLPDEGLGGFAVLDTDTMTIPDRLYTRQTSEFPPPNINF